MFKWSGPPREAKRTLLTTMERLDIESLTDAAAPFANKFLLEGPTHYRRKLHIHLSELKPGGSYAAHADAHDVAIVALSGTLETMGRRAARRRLFSGGQNARYEKRRRDSGALSGAGISRPGRDFFRAGRRSRNAGDIRDAPLSAAARKICRNCGRRAPATSLSETSREIAGEVFQHRRACGSGLPDWKRSLRTVPPRAE
jgi:hypothetical protein